MSTPFDRLRERTQVVVVGGGIVGTATALHLAEAGVEVEIVEADPTFAKAATGKGTGGIRQLFTRPENILLSQYTLDVVEDWAAWAGASGEPAGDLGWRANGYLFVAGPDEVDQLRRNFETQQAHGVDAEWLEPAELGARHPELRVDDLAGAVLSPRDGWLDPSVFVAGVRARARAAGVTFVHDRVVELTLDGDRISGVRLKDGGLLTADAVMVCAGTWTPQLVAPLGMTLPIEPMRRHEHYVTASATADDLPFVKDVNGLAIHAHDGGFSIGLVDFDHPGGEDFTVDETYFGRVVEPATAHRLSGLSDFVEERTWTGLYDQNRLDGNAVVGSWPGRHDNLYVAAGFSGHGFMHALGVGRALTEHFLTGAYVTVDLTNLGYARVEAGEPYAELGVR
jgi:FAD-dependent oxidoreductase domain-containing protein 1